MTDWTKRLAIISDEAADSFAEAADFCLPLGIRAYELRKLEGGRFPQVTERAIQEVLDTVAAKELDLIGVSPGFFKGPLDAEVIERTFEQDLPKAFRLMERLGIRRMTLFTFRRKGPDDPIPAEIYDHLGRAIEVCAREGIEVVLENAASIYSNTGANLATIARTLGVNVVWDPANGAASGDASWRDGYEEVRARLAHVHFKNWRPADGFVAINDGVVDMAGQAAALIADEYPGYYCLEPHQWNDRKNAVRKNCQQLLSLLGSD